MRDRLTKAKAEGDSHCAVVVTCVDIGIRYMGYVATFYCESLRNSGIDKELHYSTRSHLAPRTSTDLGSRITFEEVNTDAS